MGNMNLEYTFTIPVALKKGDIFIVDYPHPTKTGRNNRSDGCSKGSFFYMESNLKIACILN